MDQHIDLARLVVNAIMTSYSATILQKSIKATSIAETPLRHVAESRRRR
jgi:hypothetical protein